MTTRKPANAPHWCRGGISNLSVHHAIILEFDGNSFRMKTNPVSEDLKPKKLNRQGHCAVAVCLGVLPALFIKERPQPADADAPLPLLKSIKTTFSNRAFLALTGCVFCVLLGMFMAGPLGLSIVFVVLSWWLFTPANPSLSVIPAFVTGSR